MSNARGRAVRAAAAGLCALVPGCGLLFDRGPHTEPADDRRSLRKMLPEIDRMRKAAQPPKDPEQFSRDAEKAVFS